MMDVTFRGEPITIDGEAVVCAGDDTASVLLSDIAGGMIRRGQSVSLGVTWPSVPASFDDDYARCATIVEAARIAGVPDLAVTGVESDPATVY